MGFFGALRSGQRLDAQLLLAFKRAVFAGAGRLLSDVCQRTPAVVFAALAAHHLMLALSLDDLRDQASGISEMSGTNAIRHAERLHGRCRQLRARRSVLVIDAGLRRNRFASHSHGFLGQDGSEPGEIARHLLKPGGRLLIAHGTLATVLGIGGPRRSSGHKSIAGVVKVTIADLRQLADLAAAGAFCPVIDSAYPLENAAEAHAYVDQGHKCGSVVLSVGSTAAQDRTDLVGPRDQLASLNSQSVLLPQPITALEAWRRIMARPLPGLGVAFALRDAISSRFGVKRIGGFSGGLVEVSQVGGHLDFFLIERLEDTMMTLTARDRHLDVMICIEMDGCKINITASVVTHNLFGRLYMIPVAPAHRLIVWLQLRRLLLPTVPKSHAG